MKIATQIQQAPQDAQANKHWLRPSKLDIQQTPGIDAEKDLQDSPRTHIGGTPAPRKLVLKTYEAMTLTLRAQKRAGKTDSAEMYASVFSPTAKSAVASPKSPSVPRSPFSPPAYRPIGALSSVELGKVSDEDFDDLSVGSDDEETLNTGWTEWAIDFESDDEGAHGASKPTSDHISSAHADNAEYQTLGSVQANRPYAKLSAARLAKLSDEEFEHLSVGSDDKETLNTGWTEWAIDSDDEL